jgi:hypothetical protein
MPNRTENADETGAVEAKVRAARVFHIEMLSRRALRRLALNSGF